MIIMGHTVEKNQCPDWSRNNVKSNHHSWLPQYGHYYQKFNKKEEACEGS